MSYCEVEDGDDYERDDQAEDFDSPCGRHCVRLMRRLCAGSAEIRPLPLMWVLGNEAGIRKRGGQQ